MTTVACPVCSGRRVHRIAPGFYECQTENLYNVIPAGAQGNPADVPLYRRCGHRFQVAGEGGLMGVCSCGFGAVALCTDCGKSLCGKHALTRAGRVLCSEHAVAVDTTAARVKWEAEAPQREAARIGRERDAAALQAKQDAAEAATDPIERLLRQHALGYGQPINGGQSRTVAQWFAQQAKTRGLPTRRFRQYVKPRFWDSTRQAWYEGWSVVNRPALKSGDPGYDSDRGSSDWVVNIRIDGAYFPQDMTYDPQGDAEKGLTPHGLASMAALLGYPAT